ncbi:MAG TPA: neutral/alkaline non-lysosomal ceramidase N-terminal domain-containing protein, partial [Myxococcota bacterium]|nr:neutral/alkaline non-lysosomal ceramidase N-terminal domain-containing protein [Myxococcota bacterium]
ELDGGRAVQLQLGQVIEAPGTFRVTLLRGIDAPPATPLDVTARFQVNGALADGTLTADDLVPGRNALYLSLDADGDGRPENQTSSVFRWDPLLAAACSRVITPVVGVNHSDPIYMAGFGNDRQATGVHDDLWARGWVVQNADKKIAVVTLDVIGYFNNEIRTLRELPTVSGLGFDAIMVTSTHVHEGPDTMGLWGPDQTTSGADTGYLDFVNQSVADCVAEANANLAPAEIRFATGSTVGTSLPPNPDLVADGHVLQPYVIPGNLFDPPRPGDVVVQGDPGEITNPSVPALQIRNRVTHQILATVVNFASHPESLGSDNTFLTADFPHFMRDALEAAYGGLAIYVSADLGVLQGPLDVDITDPATGQPAARRTFRFAEVMGQKLAERAKLALDGVSTWDPDPALDVRSSGRIQVRVENPFFLAASAFGVFGRRQLERDADRHIVTSTEANVLRIGPAQMALTPNELDPQIGYAYKDQMENADHKWVMGLANDEIGYQMPAEKFNPSCHACAAFVILGNDADCPIAQELGVDVVDCSTVFMNNIGPMTDTQLQGVFGGLIGELNP